MMNQCYSARQAIEESIQKNTIVTLRADNDLVNDLMALADDYTENGVIYEYWGTEDDDEWRVHLDCTGMVWIEIMPEHLRASHRAAHNWGRYPANGAQRMLVTQDEAEQWIEEDNDGYNHLV